jgi:ribonuclease BN (tRNA processing enzyme)
MTTTLISLGPVRAAAQPERCGNDKLAVQILGSGGPFSTTDRASTGYLLWRAGRAVVMVDIGVAHFSDSVKLVLDSRISLTAISHLHPDHVSDLPALLWVSECARQKPLKLAGPSSGGAFRTLPRS